MAQKPRPWDSLQSYLGLITQWSFPADFFHKDLKEKLYSHLFLPVGPLCLVRLRQNQISPLFLGILNVLTDAQEHTLVSLLYWNCVPTLTYASAVKEYKRNFRIKIALCLKAQDKFLLSCATHFNPIIKHILKVMRTNWFS